MLMYLRCFLVLLVSISLSGCLYQQSAPIEYGSTGAKKNADDYYDASTKKEEKPKIKTFWGKKEVKEKKIEREEKPLMLSEHATGKEIYHEVIEGETIDAVAKKYGISKDILIQKNDLEPPYILEELQLIMIPPKATSQELKKKPVATKTIPGRAGKLPVEGKIVSKFGHRYLGAINQGINISAKMDADIFSSSSGEVIHSAYDPKFGNLIIIKSYDEDIFMAYAHMTDLNLKIGQNIAEGQVIGHVGQTGKVTKPQLHFAVRKGKIPIDPVNYLKK